VQTRLEACGKADLMLLEARGSADWILLETQGADGNAAQPRLEACGKADLMVLEARGSADWILLEAQGADAYAAQPRSDWKRVEAPTGWCWKRRSLEDTCCADWKWLEALRSADDVEEH
jgi:hypothetical protein